MSAVDSWNQEREAVFLYGVLADVETSPDRRQLFEKLAREAESQATIWETELRRAGAAVPDYNPSARARVVARLVRRFGAERMRLVLSAMKVRGMSIYGTYGAAPPAAGGSETAHDRHPMPKSVDDIGRRHRSVSSVHGGTL